MKKLLQFLLFISFITYGRAQSIGNTLSYDGVNDYLQLSDGLVSNIKGDFTIELWVYWKGGGVYTRIFDFGTGPTNAMLLTPDGGNTSGFNNYVGFGMNITNRDYQTVNSSDSLTTNTWHHIAVTIKDITNTATMFIDGKAVGSNSNFTLRPSSNGFTNQNWLAKSQYSDPLFSGMIDELRISNVVRYTSNFTPTTNEFIPDSGTVALFHFDEGEPAQITNDASSNHFTGRRGSSINSDNDDPSWTTGSVLPIELTAFTATPNNNTSILSWNMAYGSTPKNFTIQRSTNITDFSNIGRIEIGNTVTLNRTFSFKDDVPFSGINYYRLMMIDVDGKISYSKIVAVKIDSNGKLEAYPNPAKNTLYLRIPQSSKELSTITVKDAAGRTVKTISYSTANKILITSIDISSFTPGIYYVHEINGGTITFIKQ